jgi:hypothetical protein
MSGRSQTAAMSDCGGSGSVAVSDAPSGTRYHHRGAVTRHDAGVPVEVTQERRVEFEAVLASTTKWADASTDIQAVGLAGSWARDEVRMDSDADLIVLTDNKDAYLTGATWVDEAAGSEARFIWTREWGPLTERRVLLPSGFEVEYGFAPTSWADIAPLDAGTASVVLDGFRIVYDPERLLARLIEAVIQTAL